jgi:hypothetical protein
MSYKGTKKHAFLAFGVALVQTRYRDDPKEQIATASSFRKSGLLKCDISCNSGISDLAAKARKISLILNSTADGTLQETSDYG